MIVNQEKKKKKRKTLIRTPFVDMIMPKGKLILLLEPCNAIFTGQNKNIKYYKY